MTAPQNHLRQVISFIKETFRDKTDRRNVYHNITHTSDVVEEAKKIGVAAGLNEEELEIVEIAAWFHDIGYFEADSYHELQSVKMAENFLNSIAYPAEKIERVTGCIVATKIPQSPKNLLEEVVCDADLHHLGKKEFFDRNDLFRIENEYRGNKKYDDTEWIQSNIEFFNKHRFFTAYAKKEYEEGKNLNLIKLQKKLRKSLKLKEENELDEKKIALARQKLASKKEDDSKPLRGIETMFRNVTRNHMDLSAMADNKANILISVNTIIISLVLTIMLKNIDYNPHLGIPTMILLTVSLSTIIFAVLVTRPKVNTGLFTKEDIQMKKVNLLFFGNFFKMNLDDFSWGMHEMMEDKDYLYDSMIKDFYYLGQILGKKYRFLRIAYNIFMYGLILSVMSFLAAVLLYPGSTQLQIF